MPKKKYYNIRIYDERAKEIEAAKLVHQARSQDSKLDMTKFVDYLLSVAISEVMKAK